MIRRLLFNAPNYADWRYVAKRAGRSLETLVYPSDIGNVVLADLKRFYNEKNWYQSRGIPWRRGYLLYGEPGNGKTSLVLASELQLDIYSINLGNKAMSDERLGFLLSNVPERSIVLIEEIDTWFEGRKASNDSFTFAGILNALDGVTSSEGRVLFITTNHHENLDAALIRPGRVDLQIYLGNADAEQIETMVCKFFPASTPEFTSQFVRSIPSGRVRMAALQEHLLSYRDNPLAALERVRDLVQFRT